MITQNKTGLLLCSVLFAMAGSLLVRGLLGTPETGIDDADIFLIYARHLSEGFGFIYNVGGEAVEGFTSLLWTLICALFFTERGNVEFGLGLFSVLIGALTIYVCLRRTQNQGVFLLLTASVPAWFAWCEVTLMETGLWCLIITLLGLAVAERKSGAVAALLPFMILTRPESMLWGGWAVFLMFLFAEPGKRMRSAVLPFLAYSVTLAALIGYRLHYFGYPFPNTYYAKVSEHVFTNVYCGTGYLFRYSVSHPLILVALIGCLYLSIRLLVIKEKEPGLSAKLAVFLLPGIGIPVLVGGDHFGSFRFYQPLWPLLCLIAVAAWPGFLKRCRPGLAYGALIFALLGGWVLFPLTGNLKHEFRIAKEGRANGAALVQMFGDLETWPTVAVITAGGNKYAYPGYVYDLMGLNSSEMAHAPGNRGGFKNHTGFNRDIFYRWEPDILLCGDSEEFDSMVLGGLHKEARFSMSYLKCTLHRNGAEMNAWFRNDFLMTLPGQSAPIIPDE